MSGVGDKIYEGTAELGRIRSVIGLVCGIIIGLLLFSGGAYMLSTDQSNLVDTAALIKKATCSSYYVPKDNKNMYNCNLDIEYTVESKVYNSTISASGSSPYVEGRNIEVTYEKTKPEVVQPAVLRNKWIGIGSLSFGCIIICCAAVTYYVTKKSKIAAAVYGADGVVDMFRR